MRKHLVALFALTCTTYSLASLAGDVDLTEAKKLLDQGKAKSAYAKLAPYEFAQAGNVEYDYLLGVAALEAGYPDKATLILERVVAQQPNHAGARLDLARAWLAMGEKDRAKAEFLALKQLNPPEAASVVIAQSLKLIDQQEQAERGPQVSGYIDGGLGYDTNISSVTNSFSQSVQQTYGISGLQPTGNAVQHEDGYASFGGGINYTAPIKPGQQFFAAADLHQRAYFQQDVYNSTVLGGQAGTVWNSGPHTIKVAALVQEFWQEGAATSNPKPTLNHSFVGALLDWKKKITGFDMAGLTLQAGQLRYNDLPYSNNDQYTLSGQWLHGLEGNLHPVLMSSLYFTNEDATTKLNNGSDNSRRIYGLRVGGQISLNPDIDVFALAGYQERDDKYVGARAPGVLGKDQLSDLTFGLNWKVKKDWSVVPRLTLMHNDSNIPLYAFDRADFSVTLRRDFR